MHRARRIRANHRRESKRIVKWPNPNAYLVKVVKPLTEVMAEKREEKTSAHAKIHDGRGAICR
jgi:hypothetical protein